MICTKCGAENVPESAFCAACGAPIPAEPQQPLAAQQPAEPQQPFAAQQPPMPEDPFASGQSFAQQPPKKKLPLIPILIAAAAVLAVVILAIVLLSGNGAERAAENYYEAFYMGDTDVVAEYTLEEDRDSVLSHSISLAEYYDFDDISMSAQSFAMPQWVVEGFSDNFEDEYDLELSQMHVVYLTGTASRNGKRIECIAQAYVVKAEGDWYIESISFQLDDD